MRTTPQPHATPMAKLPSYTDDQGRFSVQTESLLSGCALTVILAASALSAAATRRRVAALMSFMAVLTCSRGPHTCLQAALASFL
jgi:hypothetical protein